VINAAWLVPFFPLLGAIVVAVGARWLKGLSHWPVIGGIGLGFLVSLGLLFASSSDRTVLVFNWIDAGDLHVPFELRVDGLTTMMLSMVTFVATLVAVFAAGYMAGDPGYPRFFAVVGLFVFSMTGLVLSNNYVLTYAFWEGVGVCSYLLVGFWHAKPSAAAAAKKAFMVNRLGDLGFAVALFWLWSVVPDHNLSYQNVLNLTTMGALEYHTKVGIALLLFWAATAKSAQIPLYVWLPDAMEGPTPVSALIHAATMVTAGVYLIARSSPLIFSVPIVPLIICIVGCATALLAALIALTQTDLKRVLAYSTVSQLGFMFMALGAGVGNAMQVAVVAAMFHLFTHAFFKALLFLASGSVMHAMGGVIDMRRFRGLRHRMPITCWTFAVGGLALAGIPPLAGFFSKDEILAALKLAGSQANQSGGTGWGGIYFAIYWIAILTAFMTAFYTGRAFFLTFFGPEKLPTSEDPEADPSEKRGHGHSHEPAHGESDPHSADPPAIREPSLEPVAAEHGHGGHDSHFGHESGPMMWVPLAVLAGCAALVGIVFGPIGLFEHHVLNTLGFKNLHSHHGGMDVMSILLGILAGAGGLGLSYVMYASPSPIPGRFAAALGPLYRASYKKFGIDELYDTIIIGPTRAIAVTCKFLDIYFVDGLVRLVAWIPRFVGKDLLASLQNGLIQSYAAVTAAGVTLLLLILLLLF
jgi:proton-translocating NADH-quinone oxidoreductase chain L